MRPYTPEEDATIAQMCAVGATYLEIGTALHRSKKSVAEHVAWLGIHKAPRATCRHGHAFTPENTSSRKNGSRRCIECIVIYKTKRAAEIICAKPGCDQPVKDWRNRFCCLAHAYPQRAFRKSCIRCGEPVIRNDRAFCSRACYDASVAVAPRICALDGCNNPVRDSADKYCSKACGYAARRTPKRLCAHCGQNRVKDNRDTYCCVECWKAAKTKAKPVYLCRCGAPMDKRSKRCSSCARIANLRRTVRVQAAPKPKRYAAPKPAPKPKPPSDVVRLPLRELYRHGYALYAAGDLPASKRTDVDAICKVMQRQDPQGRRHRLLDNRAF